MRWCKKLRNNTVKGATIISTGYAIITRRGFLDGVFSCPGRHTLPGSLKIDPTVVGKHRRKLLVSR